MCAIGAPNVKRFVRVKSFATRDYINASSLLPTAPASLCFLILDVSKSEFSREKQRRKCEASLARGVTRKSCLIVYREKNSVSSSKHNVRTCGKKFDVLEYPTCQLLACVILLCSCSFDALTKYKRETFIFNGRVVSLLVGKVERKAWGSNRFSLGKGKRQD